jgi:hypothetical protein
MKVEDPSEHPPFYLAAAAPSFDEEPPKLEPGRNIGRNVKRKPTASFGASDFLAFFTEPPRPNSPSVYVPSPSPSAIRHPPSAIRHPSSAIRHPPSAIKAKDPHCKVAVLLGYFLRKILLDLFSQLL